MTTTITIRKLAEPIKQKLRMRAASHGRSMEAEAREIITLAVSQPQKLSHPEPEQQPSASACAGVRGIWKGRATTHSMMKNLRGED